jgi:hypothetical protein
MSHPPERAHQNEAEHHQTDGRVNIDPERPRSARDQIEAQSERADEDDEGRDDPVKEYRRPVILPGDQVAVKSRMVHGACSLHPGDQIMQIATTP